MIYVCAPVYTMDNTRMIAAAWQLLQSQWGTTLHSEYMPAKHAPSMNSVHTTMKAYQWLHHYSHSQAWRSSTATTIATLLLTAQQYTACTCARGFLEYVLVHSKRPWWWHVYYTEGSPFSRVRTDFRRNRQVGDHRSHHYSRAIVICPFRRVSASIRAPSELGTRQVALLRLWRIFLTK